MTRLTEKQIDDRLIALHAALVDKLDVQPFMEPALRREPGKHWRITLYREFIPHGNYVIATVGGTSISKAIDAADALVARMPARSEMKLRDFQKKLAEVIDEAEALSLPTDVVAPLREGSQALANNL